MQYFDLHSLFVRFVLFVTLFLLGEFIAYWFFKMLRNKMREETSKEIRQQAMTKGILERLVLVTGLVNGFPQIIIAFGALKVATRLHEEKNNQITNDYFLTGNLLSLLVVFNEAIVYEHFLPAIMQTFS